MFRKQQQQIKKKPRHKNNLAHPKRRTEKNAKRRTKKKKTENHIYTKKIHQTKINNPLGALINIRTILHIDTHTHSYKQSKFPGGDPA